jgi:hypothetical protein
VITPEMLARLVPVPELDVMTTDEVCFWFNKQRGTANRTLMENAALYGAARDRKDHVAMEAAGRRLHQAWMDLRDIKLAQDAYRDHRAARGLTAPSEASQRAKALEAAQEAREAAARVAAEKARRAQEQADHQRRSFGSVVHVDTGNVEYRLREKRWRERSDRHRRDTP